MKTILYPTPPFDFNKMKKRLLRTKQAHLYRELDHRLYRVIRLNQQLILFSVQYLETELGPSLEVQFHTGHEFLSPKELEKGITMIKRMFSIDIPLHQFYEKMEGSPQMKPLIQSFYGLRFLLEPDLFECMVKTIISQQLNLPFAAALTQRVIDTFGETLEWEGEIFPVFPSPERMASIAPDQLRQMQFSQRKAEYVIDFAKSVERGAVNLDRLYHLSDQEVFSQLLPLRGIGRWTVECLMMFGMGRTDVLPAADIGLRNGVKKVFGLDSQPDEEYVRKLGEDWSPWRSYATFYLWESLADS
ncbi:DNA-3-methyladenine glycosylase [Microaerobacter geothermalis]|uniref:DNA-3-methyladenine glycosylase family protein n=1 Tax=Microaerobacter geothermalis TaxID=674972 RepID=UPI001F34677A|nr:DNA-3-methyladenine glycosylase [Microaerobacter geothermalis]MCF6093925.1 DNA-3-methyladenine glycosylase [Microaerobacter geothermalis]